MQPVVGSVSVSETTPSASAAQSEQVYSMKDDRNTMLAFLPPSDSRRVVVLRQTNVTTLE